ncbi:MAG: hypothetical protein U0841_30110 [Chloroflexia bacterium]
MAGHIREGNGLTEEGIALLDALAPADRDRLAAIDTTSDPLDAQNGRGDLALALGETGPFAQAVALGERIVGLPTAQTAGSRGDAYYGLAYAYAALGEPVKARRAFAAARAIFRADDHRTMVVTTLFEELVLVIYPYQTDQREERRRLEAELGEAFATLDAVFVPRSARAAGVVTLLLEGLGRRRHHPGAERPADAAAHEPHPARAHDPQPGRCRPGLGAGARGAAIRPGDRTRRRGELHPADPHARRRPGPRRGRPRRRPPLDRLPRPLGGLERRRPGGGPPPTSPGRRTTARRGTRRWRGSGHCWRSTPRARRDSRSPC